MKHAIRRAALSLLGCALLTASLFAQVPTPNGSNSTGQSKESFTAGRFIAANYGYKAQVVSGNAATGSASFTVRAGYVVLTDGRAIVPFSVGVPIVVSDASPELVTPTSVSGCNKTGPNGIAGGQDLPFITCTITAVFANTHGAGAEVLSATGGVAEAAIDAFNNGGGVVTISPGWRGKLNTSCTGCYANQAAVMAGILPLSNVSFEDVQQGPAVYWNLTPASTTVLSTPTALTGQAACDATHQFCSDSTVAGSASWGGSIFCGVTYVDILGNESITSTTASFTSVASKAIDIASPAASTGAVGWKPYCSLSGGTYALAYSIPLVTQPSTVGAYPVSNGVCTLTSLETIVPACALTNATYGQTGSVVGKNSLFKGGAQITGYPVVTSMLAPNLDSASAQSLNPSNGGLQSYAYAPSSHLWGGVQPFFMSFPITTAAQSTIGQVAGTIPLQPGFMNTVGKTVRVCGMLSKTSTTADTITNIQLWWDAEGSNVTAGTAVELSNIQITATLTAAATVSFCQDITTTVAASGATGGTILPGAGWLTEAQVAAGSIHFASTNILLAAVGSLNLANFAKLEVVYNHTTGTDGAGVVLINPTVIVLN